MRSVIIKHFINSSMTMNTLMASSPLTLSCHILQNVKDQEGRSTEVTFDVMEWAFTADMTNEQTGAYIYTLVMMIYCFSFAFFAIYQ